MEKIDESKGPQKWASFSKSLDPPLSCRIMCVMAIGTYIDKRWDEDVDRFYI